MNFETLKTEYKTKILEIAKSCKAKDIKVFGSILHGELPESSDIDFLVKMQPDSGFAIGGLKWRLEELLHRKVDIVTENALHHLIKEQILKEARHL